MFMNVLPIGEARRRLPELVRKVAQGHPPVGIGRRGKVEVVLSAAPPAAQAKRRPLRGLIRLVDEDLQGADAEILQMFRASLARTSEQLEPVRRVERRTRTPKR
jgi:prevent-host-death family protein